MSKNNLLIVIAVLSIGILVAYWFKVYVPQEAEQQQQQQQNWQNWGPDSNSSSPPSSEATPPPTQPPSTPTSYQQALEIAKTHNKSVLLFFTADWCSYCKQMKTQTFSNADVQKEISNFVYYEVNVDKEKGIATKYNVRSMPSYKIIDANEKVLSEDGGFKSPKDFIAWLRGTLKKANPFRVL